MNWVQFWLLLAAIYDAAFRVRIADPRLPGTALWCILAAAYCTDVVQAFLKGLIGS